MPRNVNVPGVADHFIIYSLRRRIKSLSGSFDRLNFYIITEYYQIFLIEHYSDGVIDSPETFGNVSSSSPKVRMNEFYSHSWIVTPGPDWA